MTTAWIQLRDFGVPELIFDDQETRDILRFFFREDQSMPGALEIDYALKNFAQGLLIEAVDVTYEKRWLELSFKWVANPAPGVRSALQKLAGRADSHWFKNAKDEDLLHATVIDCIRNELAMSFRRQFHILAQGGIVRSRLSPNIAFVQYGAATANEIAWA